MNELSEQSLTTVDTVYALSDIPDAPPFLEIEIYLSVSALAGYKPADSNLEGYVIEFDPFSDDLRLIIQDDRGVRKIYHLFDGVISNDTRSWLPYIFIPGMKVKLEMQQEENDQSYLYVRFSTIRRTSQIQESSPYLCGVPPAPPYQFVEIVIMATPYDDCSKPDEPVTGYVIKAYQEGFDNVVIIQDEMGVRKKCRWTDSDVSETDKQKLSFSL